MGTAIFSLTGSQCDPHTVLTTRGLPSSLGDSGSCAFSRVQPSALWAVFPRDHQFVSREGNREYSGCMEEEQFPLGIHNKGVCGTEAAKRDLRTAAD